MTLASMTGFARAEGRQEDFAWVWELKSVNGKSLEPRFRLPLGFDHLEPRLRGALAAVLKRGNISAALTITRDPSAGALRVNREALAQIIAIVNELQHQVEAAPPRLDGLLGLRGVLESGATEVTAELREARDRAVMASFDQALAELAETRRAEGARLGAVLAGHLREIERLAHAAEACAAVQPAALKARLKHLLATLLEAQPSLPEDRLAQEVALLITRADIREEIDRLKAHIAGAQDLLGEAVAVGRRFDFLCQEFNREANTLCSKSADLELTRIGLALKAAIEQLREQIQNIE